MPPLSLELYDPKGQKWTPLSPILNPGDPPGSFSQNLPDGSRELYMFECAEDDSQSIIYRSPSGLDIADLRGGRDVFKTEDSDWDLVKELKRGDPPYDLTIRTDFDSQGRIIRFTHK